jgi:pilus assembly protein CpaB
MRNPLLLALLCALVGGLLLHVYLARFELELAGGEPRGIVMVTSDVAPGQVVTERMLSVRRLPERYLEERHIRERDLARVIGTRCTTGLDAGSALLWTDLDVANEGRTLASLVRSGMRAFALADHDLSFRGQLRAGDRVDVLWTGQDGSSLTRTMLQNVLVLSVGDELTRENGRREAAGNAPVTLSVSVADAQLLAHAQQRGRLRLVLRNPQDLALSEPGVVNDGNLLHAPPSQGGER